MEKQQQRGRPSVGVPKNTVNSYVDCIDDWIRKRLLPKWLKDIERDLEAAEAYEQLDLLASNRHELLTAWCETWLSTEGWKRLQANARQKRYKHRELMSGPKYKRISIERDAALDLEDFSQRHGMTLTEAVKHLLKASRHNANS